MTEGLYAELLDTNVGVSVVFPGAVATEITSNSGVEIPGNIANGAEMRARTTSPEDAARIILDGIEAGDLQIFVGRDSKMMNLFNRVSPKRSTHLIYKQMKSLLSS